MGLADAIADAKAPKGPLCGVVRIREQLKGEDAAAFEEALADKWVTSPQLVRALAAIGVQAPKTAITRHRRKECNCGQ